MSEQSTLAPDDHPGLSRRSAGRLFTPRSVWMIAGGLVIALIVANRFVHFVCANVTPFDCQPFWPFSEFSLRPPMVIDLVVAIVVSIGFLYTRNILSRTAYRLSTVIVASILLILGTNYILGWTNGYQVPMIGGGGEQYYADAQEIDDFGVFFRDYTTNQAERNLGIHARVHPPGAVLLIWTLAQLFSEPGLISAAIGVIAVPLAAFFMNRIFRAQLGDQTQAGTLTFLCFLIPSIQIYTVATVDAIIAGLMVGWLYFFLQPRCSVGIIGAIICLFLASFITFVAVFVLPVMAGFELWRRRSLVRTVLIVGGVALMHGLVYLLTSYNYVDSFFAAARIDNPYGFMLFADPVNYLFTRLEGMAEFVVFFGPFLSILAVRGLPALRRSSPDFFALTALALLTLGGMFAVGMFRYGETARILMFVLPYLLLVVGAYLNEAGVSQRDRSLLLALVFFQAVLMQTFGIYIW
ncbi:MAG: hypothetical protein H7175_08365 [Burkholderiales bacterium]|nr:hypothetical protein [Anaerolineae bacterium]